jgi:hypothetical protein
MKASLSGVLLAWKRINAIPKDNPHTTNRMIGKILVDISGLLSCRGYMLVI